MRALARLAQLEARPPGDDLLAEGAERLEDRAQAHLLGPAAIERQHVEADALLQRRVVVELVEDDLGIGVALELDDDAHPVAVGLVAQVGDALDHLVLDALGDGLDQLDLVHLERDLADDDRLAVLADVLEVGLAAHGDAAAAGPVGLDQPGAAADDAAGREVRARHELEQPGLGDVGVVDAGDAGVDDLAEIVRRHGGRHAHGDAVRAVDQQVRELGRQHDRLDRLVVVGGLELDRVLVDVGQQRSRGAVQARLGVAHRRRRIAVHRAEIALPLDERQAHGEVLRHAHERVVDRRVAMRVVLAHDVADHARGLAERLGPVVARLVHRVEDAPVDRLEAVADVGKRARHDHAHGVIEVGALHLLFDRDRGDVARLGARRFGHFVPAGGACGRGWNPAIRCPRKLARSPLERQRGTAPKG
jgi:hypothetical protein